MNILCFDSSSELVSFAVMLEDRVVSAKKYRRQQGASFLIPRIKKELDKLQLSLSCFDAFCVGAGPGSFTGLRVAFSIAKGLSLALDKPVISLGSFLACAYRLKMYTRRIAVISDARRGLIYGAVFRIRRGKIIREKKEVLCRLDDFIEAHRDYTFCTYNSYLRDKAKSIYSDIDFYPRDIWPEADALLMVACGYYVRGKFTSRGRLKPLYIYPQDCQVRVDKGYGEKE